MMRCVALIISLVLIGCQPKALPSLRLGGKKTKAPLGAYSWRDVASVKLPGILVDLASRKSGKMVSETAFSDTQSVRELFDAFQGAIPTPYGGSETITFLMKGGRLITFKGNQAMIDPYGMQADIAIANALSKKFKVKKEKPWSATLLRSPYWHREGSAEIPYRCDRAGDRISARCLRCDSQIYLYL